MLPSIGIIGGADGPTAVFVSGGLSWGWLAAAALALLALVVRHGRRAINTGSDAVFLYGVLVTRRSIESPVARLRELRDEYRIGHRGREARYDLSAHLGDGLHGAPAAAGCTARRGGLDGFRRTARILPSVHVFRGQLVGFLDQCQLLLLGALPGLFVLQLRFEPVDAFLQLLLSVAFGLVLRLFIEAAYLTVQVVVRTHR